MFEFRYRLDFQINEVCRALRVFLAVTRLTVLRQCEVAGSVIGPPIWYQHFYVTTTGFSGITFFLLSDFNEI